MSNCSNHLTVYHSQISAFHSSSVTPESVHYQPSSRSSKFCFPMSNSPHSSEFDIVCF
ncbi:hypothetical protein HanIR_Chr11g0544201 [Helianthus annuus]|nr:hypothetical protein HanIR_Chr11g0544201 [Helianthus annuus]